MKTIVYLLSLICVLGLSCSNSVGSMGDTCEGIAINEFDQLERQLIFFIYNLDKRDGDEENFIKIESFLNNFNCIDQVKIFRGYIKTQPMQKEFRIDFNTGVAKIIDVYILENDYAYYRMHD